MLSDSITKRSPDRIIRSISKMKNCHFYEHYISDYCRDLKLSYKIEIQKEQQTPPKCLHNTRSKLKSEHQFNNSL